MDAGTLEARCQRLERAAQMVRTAGDAARREQFRTVLLSTSKPLLDERRRLVEQMERGWVWLDAHPGHAEFATREDRWLEWDRKYRRVEDALYRSREAYV